MMMNSVSKKAKIDEKNFEQFSLALKITANQCESVSKKPVSKKPEWM